MARYQASMRMGALNLLILIIALSLAVLSVLTLVTAHANASLAERQAVAAAETYAEESAGQTFLSSLDQRLLPSKAAGRIVAGLNSTLKWSLQDYADEACEKAMLVNPDVELTSKAELLNVKDLYVNMKVSFDIRGNIDDEDALEELLPAGSSSLSDPAEGEEIIEDDGQISAEVNIYSGSSGGFQPGDTEYYLSMANVLEECVGGVKLTITSSTGRNLDALIGFKANGQYVILSWTSSKAWYGDEKKETLWMG